MGTKFAAGFAKGEEGRDVAKKAAREAMEKGGMEKVDFAIVFSCSLPV